MILVMFYMGVENGLSRQGKKIGSGWPIIRCRGRYLCLRGRNWQQGAKKA